MCNRIRWICSAGVLLPWQTVPQWHFATVGRVCVCLFAVCLSLRSTGAIWLALEGGALLSVDILHPALRALWLARGGMTSQRPAVDLAESVCAWERERRIRKDCGSDGFGQVRKRSALRRRRAELHWARSVWWHSGCYGNYWCEPSSGSWTPGRCVCVKSWTCWFVCWRFFLLV